MAWSKWCEVDEWDQWGDCVENEGGGGGDAHRADSDSHLGDDVGFLGGGE